MQSLGHIHVLTSCTGRKVSTTRPVTAEALYRGQHHVRLMRGVTEARELGLEIDLSIVSAGHGVLAGVALLMPYEKTFSGQSGRDRQERARRLGIPGDVRRALARPVDLHVVLLGEDYLEACEFGADIRASAPVVVLAAVGVALRMPPIGQFTMIPLSTNETRRFHCGLVGLKGEIGSRLLAHIARVRPSIDQLAGESLLDELALMRAPEAVRTATVV